MYIKIHATTDAKKEIVEKKADDRYDISVREPAEENRANERILEIIRHMHPNMIVRLVHGHHAFAKIISLEDKT